MCKAALISLFLLLFLHQSNAQSFPFAKEIKFAQYLQNKEQYADANLVLTSIDTTVLTLQQKDSLNYEKAWFAYTQKKLDTAIVLFNKISTQDTRFAKAQFFAAYCMAFQKRLSQSEAALLAFNTSTDSLQNELKSFQLAGVALLKRDYEKYRQLSQSFTFNSYVFRNEEANFKRYDSALSLHKKKSPVVAGILSGIIPGSGKWYAGKKKQGVAAFLPVVVSGLLTLEAYKKGGLRDARFWLYGTVFSTIYIGNIWGSVFSVKIKNQEFNRSYDNKILFDMHIPIRNFFN